MQSQTFERQKFITEAKLSQGTKATPHYKDKSQRRQQSNQPKPITRLPKAPKQNKTTQQRDSNSSQEAKAQKNNNADQKQLMNL